MKKPLPLPTPTTPRIMRPTERNEVNFMTTETSAWVQCSTDLANRLSTALSHFLPLQLKSNQTVTVAILEAKAVGDPTKTVL